MNGRMPSLMLAVAVAVAIGVALPVLSVSPARGADDEKAAQPKAKAETKADAGPAADASDDDGPEHIVKTEAEWARQLTRAQFLVCRMKETEPPFSGHYVHSKVPGTFTCVACGAKLFSSKTKFESGTGWPSFWRPYSPRSLDAAPDTSEGQIRTEVTCHRCGAHLGHVFSDGPPPTGLRYCINSVALKLVPDKAAAPAKAAKGKARPKASARAHAPTHPKPKASPSPSGAQPAQEPAEGSTRVADGK